MRARRERSTSQSERLATYLGRLSQFAVHADRIVPMQNYTKGLFLPIERKSIEPMAARLAPGNVRQMHQSLHHIVAEAAWSDSALLREVRREVLPAMTRKDPIAAWIVDDTGFPKKGTHSVGVTRQYCGQVGKQENCRVAVSLSVETWSSSLPIGYRLYLPKEWAEDAKRREKTEVPKEVEFQTKPDIALEQIRAAVAEKVARGCGSGRRRLRHQHRVSRRARRTRPEICGGRAKLDDSLGAWQTAFASQATRENGTTSAAIAADHGPSTCFREAARDESALHCLPGNHLA